MKVVLSKVVKTILNKKTKQAVYVLYNATGTFLDKKINVLLGASGSGKTFLLKVISGVESIDSGEIYYDGEDITNTPVSKRNTSYLSQNNILYPHLTVFDNIAYPLKLMNLDGDEIRKRVNDTLKAFGIEYLQTRKPKQLSGGEAQRVAIARAIIKRPELLLLDEPFSNIDKMHTAEFLKLIKDINKLYSTTIIYVTHSISDAWALADNLLIMDNGEIIESGKIDELYNDKESFLYKNFIDIGEENVLHEE